MSFAPEGVAPPRRGATPSGSERFTVAYRGRRSLTFALPPAIVFIPSGDDSRDHAADADDGRGGVGGRGAEALRREVEFAHHARVPVFDGVESGDVLAALVLDGVSDAQYLRPRGEYDALVSRHRALPELRAEVARDVREAPELVAEALEVLDDFRRPHLRGAVAERVAVVVAAHGSGQYAPLARELAVEGRLGVGADYPEESYVEVLKLREGVGQAFEVLGGVPVRAYEQAEREHHAAPEAAAYHLVHLGDFVLPLVHRLYRVGVQRLKPRVDVSASGLRHEPHGLLVLQDVEGERAAPGLLQRNQRLAKLAQVARVAAEVVVEEREDAVEEAEVVLVPTHLELYLFDHLLDRAVAVTFVA